MALILILEDDEVIRGQLARMLKDKGHNVEEAADVKEFDSKPHDNISLFLLDVYLLDVILPDGSGYDICENIRDKTEAPIIFITSSDDEESVVKGLDIGGDDYITKPFRMSELMSRISANLRRQAMLDTRNSKLYTLGTLSINFNTLEVKKAGKDIL